MQLFIVPVRAVNIVNHCWFCEASVVTACSSLKFVSGSFEFIIETISEFGGTKRDEGLLSNIRYCFTVNIYKQFVVSVLYVFHTHGGLYYNIEQSLHQWRQLKELVPRL